MISSEQADKMVTEKMEREAAQSAQTEQPNEKPVQEPTTDPEPSKTENEPEPVGEEPKEPKDSQESEPSKDKPSQDTKEESKSEKQPPKKQFSHEERTAHAFAQEKAKRKALREENEKLKERNKQIEAELEKYKGLTLDDFEGKVGDFTDWRIKEHEMQQELQRNREAIASKENEAICLETDRRVQMSFDTQEERDEYYELVNNNWKAFADALKEHDPRGVILETLNDEEMYPKVLKELMSNMDALKYVFREKTPRKLRRNFEDFVDDFLDGKKPWLETAQTEQIAQPQSAPREPAVKALPIIGKQVTTSSAPQEPVHDRAYWNNYLRQHP